MNDYILLLIALVGMLSHFLKKKIKGETITQIKHYFADHFKTTLLSLIATVIGYYAYLQYTETPDIIAVFLIGYTCDSLFNKWESESK